MGFSLGSIVSDVTSLVTDPGKAVKDICDAVLPSNMKAIGDIVGGAVDFETGNPLQALGHLTDALKDLPQMAQGLSTTAAKTAAAPVGTAAAEPTPPPPRTPATATAATSTAGSAASQTPATPSSPTNVNVSTGGASAAAASTTLRPGEQVTIRMDANGRGVTITERPAPATRTSRREVAHQRRPAWTEASRPRPASQPSAPTTTTPPTTTAPSASGSAASSAPVASSATTKPETTTASAAAGASATTASASGSSSSGAAATGAASTAAAGTGSAATPSSLAGLMAMSPDQFMQAVTSGNIPPDVANNPSAMTQIQARMNQITQMNQLVTSMMAAMHQMQMSIIQNIRV